VLACVDVGLRAGAGAESNTKVRRVYRQFCPDLVPYDCMLPRQL
jgi:hypothetical protein